MGAISASLVFISGHATATVDFEPRTVTKVTQFVQGIAVGDLDGDTRPDVVATTAEPGFVVPLLNQPGGVLTKGEPVAMGGYAKSVALLDVNDDGALDAAVDAAGERQLRLLLGDGSGGFQPLAWFADATAGDGIGTGDFDGDGAADLVVEDFGVETLSVFLGDGAGGFVRSRVSTGGSPLTVGVAELTGDDHLDLWVTHVSGVRVLVGLGDGTFTPGAMVRTRTFTEGATTADFDADGVADIAVVDSFLGNVRVARGTGEGRFGQPADLLASGAPGAVAAGDVNADGIPDLVVANRATNDVSVFEGLGGGRFARGVQFAVGASPHELAIADMNEDGRGDVVVGLARSVSVLVSRPLTSGTGTAKVRVSCPTPRRIIDRNVGCLTLGTRPAQVLEAMGRPRSTDRFGRFLRFSYPGRVVLVNTEWNLVERIVTTRRDDVTSTGVRVGTPGSLVRRRYPKARCSTAGSQTICVNQRRFWMQTRFTIVRDRVSRIELRLVD